MSRLIKGLAFASVTGCVVTAAWLSSVNVHHTFLRDGQCIQEVRLRVGATDADKAFAKKRIGFDAATTKHEHQGLVFYRLSATSPATIRDATLYNWQTFSGLKEGSDGKNLQEVVKILDNLNSGKNPRPSV